MDSKNYVKNFGKITIKSICKDLKIDATNISSGRASKENFDKVKEEIEDKIAKLYVKEIK